jgi:hypothetical protein
MHRMIKLSVTVGLTAVALCSGMAREPAKRTVESQTLTPQDKIQDNNKVAIVIWPPLDSAGFKEFSERVQQYIKLQKAAESDYPIKKTNDPHELHERKEALIKKTREARKDARRGDIFTPAATKAFRQAIEAEFKGPIAPHARKTILEGDPLKKFDVFVNQVYPDKLPMTTVPPTLLLRFPTLPNHDVAYRILGSHLLLVDTKTGLIVDFAPDILPAVGAEGGK